MELDFRQCTEPNLVALLAISKDTFVQAFEKDNNTDDFKSYIRTAFTTDTLLAQLRNPNSFFYFAYVNNQLIGYIKLNQNQAQTELVEAGGMELERIYVLEAFQGKGYGKVILQKVKQLALRAGKVFVWLGVWEKNTSAVRFYQRYGFHKFGTHPYYIGTDKQTDWLMRHDLTTLLV